MKGLTLDKAQETILTDRQTDRQTVRDSGIELFKKFAVFIIVINHVVQTLTSDNIYKVTICAQSGKTERLFRFIGAPFRFSGTLVKETGSAYSCHLIVV